jgi:hypothetical protein
LFAVSIQRISVAGSVAPVYIEAPPVPVLPPVLPPLLVPPPEIAILLNSLNIF